MKNGIYGTASVRTRKQPFGLIYGQTGDILTPRAHRNILFRPHGRPNAVELSADELAFGNDVPYDLETHTK